MEVSLNIEIGEVGSIDKSVTAINLVEGFLKANYKVKNVVGIVYVDSQDNVSLTIACDIKNFSNSAERIQNTIRNIVKESLDEQG